MHRLEQHHINYLTHESTLTAWADKSIVARTLLFHRRFLDKKIKIWRLRAIYKANGIKKKAIRAAKIPQGYDREKLERLTQEMRNKVQEAYDEDKMILWLDETVFTKAANVTHSWSRKHQNIQVPAELMGFKYVAALATISFGRGFEYYKLLDGAVNE